MSSLISRENIPEYASDLIDISGTDGTMVILIGIPGSGKSTYSNYIKRNLNHRVGIASTDYYFEEGGRYHFDPELLDVNHRKNRNRAAALMMVGREVVIVDNTNLSVKEIKQYVELANYFEYKVKFKFFDADVEEAFERCEKRSESTGKTVPLHVIERMKSKLVSNTSSKQNNIYDFIEMYEAGKYKKYSKPLYYGVFFSDYDIISMVDDSGAKIPSGVNVVENFHMTTMYCANKTDYEFDQYAMAIHSMLGKPVVVSATMIASDANCMAIAINKKKKEMPVRLHHRINNPHITIYTVDGVKPAYAGDMLENEQFDYYAVDNKLTGTVGAWFK